MAIDTRYTPEQPAYLVGRFEKSEETREKDEKFHRLTQTLWLAFGGLEALILFRILLKFMAVNPADALAQVVYGLSAPFVAPFASFTVNPTYGFLSLELTSMMAMIVYALTAWVIAQAVYVLVYRTYHRPAHAYRRVR